MSTIIVELTRGMDGAVGLAFFRKSATSSRYVVTACKANGAAAKSGELAGGDEILKVDATFTDGLPVEHVTSLLRSLPLSVYVIFLTPIPSYGVATVSRIDKVIGLFCRIMFLL